MSFFSCHRLFANSELTVVYPFENYPIWIGECQKISDIAYQIEWINKI